MIRVSLFFAREPYCGMLNNLVVFFSLPYTAPALSDFGIAARRSAVTEADRARCCFHQLTRVRRASRAPCLSTGVLKRRFSPVGGSLVAESRPFAPMPPFACSVGMSYYPVPQL